ncbi:MAG: hypothetical protein K8S97_16080, partial [Anaerolineae bacterium]|nr:hypothetical protein [Anaerolineae bacterium]
MLRPVAQLKHMRPFARKVNLNRQFAARRRVAIKGLPQRAVDIHIEDRVVDARADRQRRTGAEERQFERRTELLTLHVRPGIRHPRPRVDHTRTVIGINHVIGRGGMGYTRIVSEFYGIRTAVIIFVPEGDTRLLHDIRVTNISGEPLEVDVIPVFEYTHFDALKQFTNADWIPQTMQSDAVQHEGHMLLVQYPFMNKGRQVNYLTCDAPVSSFETDRKRFLGANEYGSWANPLSLQEPELGNYEARRGDNIGALLVRLGTLPPGATQRMVTQLGQASSVEEALPGIQRFWNPA